MASWTVEGFDEYFKKLAALEKDLQPIIGQAVWHGAKFAADEIRKSINALPVQKKACDVFEDGGVTADEKAGLQRGFGVSKIRCDRDVYNVKLGFSGVTSLRKDLASMGVDPGAYKGRVGNIEIARTVEYGNSVRKKTPFVRPVTRRIKKDVIAIMEQELEKQFNKIMD